ncbi:MAG: hypothetical protein NUK62_05535 [Tenericutes bacterium]|nr:hypothetical protein [Mycoplasmatota bacterium]
MNYLTSNVIQKYDDLVNQKAKKISNTIGVFALISLTIAVVLFFIDRFDDQLVFVFILVFLVIFVSLVIAFLIVRYQFTSEKPLYTFLYPKVLEEIQYNEKYDLKYETYPKIKELIKESKLFTKFASSITRCGIHYQNDYGQSISIYDTYYYTQTNNSIIIHFNGYYITVNNVEAHPIQIRSRGRPTGSHTKYIKTKNEKGLKVYCEKPHEKSNEKIRSIFNEVKDILDPKHLFVSVINQKIYIAIDINKPKRKIKRLDQQSYNDLSNKLTNLINTISNLSY